MSEKEFVDFLRASFPLLVRHNKPGSVHFACMDWRHVGEILAAGDQAYDALINLCVWAKKRAEWDPSTGPSTNSSLSSVTAKPLIGTIFSSANSVATVLMSGSTRGVNTLSRQGEEHYTRP